MVGGLLGGLLMSGSVSGDDALMDDFQNFMKKGKGDSANREPAHVKKKRRPPPLEVEEPTPAEAAKEVKEAKPPVVAKPAKPIKPEETKEAAAPEVPRGPSPGENAPALPDKSRFTLWNPTPKDQMRELSTDRPDKTESAYTVDAGHVQIETDIANYSQGDKSLGLGNWAFRLGLTNTTEFQIMMNSFSTSDEASGMGDLTLRFKKNLVGNDGGPVAFTLLPKIKLPTATGGVGNGYFEGGLATMTAIELPNGFEAGIQVEVDILKSDGPGYHPEFIASFTVGHDVIGELAMYCELFTQSSPQADAGRVATFDTGLTYKFTPTFQLDAGVNIGLTDAADPLNPFTGFSIRF